jgi:hypothetical protein
MDATKQKIENILLEAEELTEYNKSDKVANWKAKFMRDNKHIGSKTYHMTKRSVAVSKAEKLANRVGATVYDFAQTFI